MRVRSRRAWLILPLATMLLIPVALLGAPAASAESGTGCTYTPAAGGLYANVTWNGQNVCAANTDANALVVEFANSANVLFTWSTEAHGVLVPPSVVVTDARLQMFYFGFALATRDVQRSSPVPSPSGSLTLNWTPSELEYVLAGLYRLTASLINANGTIWSMDFYVRANAPVVIFAGFPLILLVLIVYELYSVAVSGRYISRRRPPKPISEFTPPTTEAVSKSAPSAPAAATAESPPPEPPSEGAE